MIGHLEAEIEFWIFHRNGENLCGRREFDIRKGFDKSCQYNRPVQYGRDAAHKSRAACAFRSLEVYMNERQHHPRGSERELFSQTFDRRRTFPPNFWQAQRFL